MNIKEKIDTVVREFKLTTLALKNKTSIFLITVVVVIFGLYSYNSMPKELFPDMALPYIMVQTIYPGNPPIDIENLVTRPIEKEVESIDGIKKLTSTSSQGFSSVFIEFNQNVKISDALQEVKDAVDKAKSELPNDLPQDPIVQDIDMSEFPIININLSGDYSIDELKEYGEILEERIEAVSEISKVEIRGINEKEIKILSDPYKMTSYKVSFKDLENAVAFENVSVSGGEIKLGDTRRSLRTIGEFESIDEIKNIIVKDENGDIVYLKDIADVIEGYEESTSYTRLNNQPVVSIQVVKKSGENLISATEKIDDILTEVREKHLIPEDLHISITNDQSEMVKMQLSNLENSMVMSIIFVVGVLFFFLGTRNSLFVGIAIPLSMLMSFIVLSLIDYRVNMIVLFALILALGMLVDNAIVVVENIHRFIEKGYTKFEAAKQAVGEIATPIIVSTATTLAAFLPLAFWDSTVGKFMGYLPVTLIIVLTSSLFVALVIVPVFAITFSKKGAQNEKPNKKRALIIISILFVLAMLGYIFGLNVFANLMSIAIIITALNVVILNKIGKWFQNVFLVKLENVYLKVLKFTLRKWNPVIILFFTFALMIFTIIFYFVIRSPQMEFFPSNDPKYINILAELPPGTDIDATNDFMLELQNDIIKYIGEDNKIVESILMNIGEGARAEKDNTGGPNKGLITVTFVDYEERREINTSDILKNLSDKILGKYPGVKFKVEQNRMGPPTSGSPINLEISGEDFNRLIYLSDTIQHIIEKSNIKGIVGLKMDLNIGKPEMIVSIDRERARRYGLSTGQIASTLRTALYGKEISDFKIGEDEYPINLRLKSEYRNSIPALMNQSITFRNTKGKIVQVPISAVADYKYSTTFDAVKRKDVIRVITLSSNAIKGYNANEINQQIDQLLADFNMPEGYTYKFTGEQEDMKDSMAFLSTAMLIAISLIGLILVTQFNSIVKPIIILASILLSTIGVFGGLGTFNMNFIVVMTGVGIVALAGVVVNNAIVLIDYIDLLKQRKRKELGLEKDEFLPLDIATECVILGGKTRLRPVLLTAITTILGLLPMAIGVNIDFASLLSNFNPKFSIGGDMTMIWAPISWTIIFGLTFATFLTLIIVPAMYRIATRGKFFILKLTGKLG